MPNDEYLTTRSDQEGEIRRDQDEKMRTIGRLASGVAHDFNNILTSILGNAEIVKNIINDFPDNDTPDSTLKDIKTLLVEHIEEIMKDGHRAADLTNQLLTYSRNKKFQFEVISVDEEIAAMHKMITRLMRENINISFNTNGTGKFIQADKTQFMQVMLNLATNARDAMPNGGDLTISISDVDLTEEDSSEIPNSKIGEFIKISVEDNGEGIDSKKLQNIFEPFYTTKKQGQGTGLGLATTQAIICQHHGFINVTTTIGEGTCFDLYFPSFGGDEAPPSFVPQLDNAEKLNGNYKILLIEDDVAIANLIRRVLVRDGCKLFIFTNADEALEFYKQSKEEIDIIISDYMTSGKITGYELIEQIKRDNPQQKVLLMSGYLEPEIQNDINNFDIHFLAKPYKLNQLIHCMKEILGD
ncbi:response regulator [Patescibacteria group bacterium]|nr:response regulator [Patescibacteria group bacterium]